LSRISSFVCDDTFVPLISQYGIECAEVYALSKSGGAQFERIYSGGEPTVATMKLLLHHEHYMLIKNDVLLSYERCDSCRHFRRHEEAQAKLLSLQKVWPTHQHINTSM
jgi:hypothetical protein